MRWLDFGLHIVVGMLAFGMVLPCMEWRILCIRHIIVHLINCRPVEDEETQLLLGICDATLMAAIVGSEKKR